jgi:ornithine cyclodeaminase/alanine dehydrogenase-like protein (mu-crystallin family)
MLDLPMPKPDGSETQSAAHKIRAAGQALARRRGDLGEDHPDALCAAHRVAHLQRTSGNFDEARRLDEDTLTRRRRILGDDHPDTLSSANNLAHVLRMLDEYEYARRIDEDTLARRRRVLGDDHPDTLSSANNLVIDLAAVGEHRRARQLDEYINERTADDSVRSGRTEIATE